jgi:hypothetical protein
MLAAAFVDGLPTGLAGLVDLDLADRLLADFKLGIVLPFGGGPTRLAVSDEGDPTGWVAWIHSRWGAVADTFLASGPPGCRRMVDTDGRTARLFLDDLHEHGCPEMCRMLALPSGGESHYTRHSSLPLVLLPRELRDTAQLLTGGLWGLCWDQDRCIGGLWISESRWRKDPERTAALVEQALDPPPPWGRCRDALAPLGWRLYPDAVELRKGNQIDVTLGWVKA